MSPAESKETVEISTIEYNKLKRQVELQQQIMQMIGALNKISADLNKAQSELKQLMDG